MKKIDACTYFKYFLNKDIEKHVHLFRDFY